MSTYELHHGDCLEVMPTLAAGLCDAIICDPPFGTTACRWDSVIPFAPMWEQLKRLVKPHGAIVLFGSQPFTSALVMSNPTMFRYDLIWSKIHTTGFGNATTMPLRAHEHLLVFANGRTTYNPQKTRRTPEELKRQSYKSVTTGGSDCYGKELRGTSLNRFDSVDKYPNSVVTIHAVHNQSNERSGHPNEKPLALLEYLIRTYTNEGDTVLDFTMGSGTTGHACATTGRRFVGIEQDAGYFEVARKRIADAYAAPVQLELAS